MVTTQTKMETIHHVLKNRTYTKNIYLEVLYGNVENL